MIEAIKSLLSEDFEPHLVIIFSFYIKMFKELGKNAISIVNWYITLTSISDKHLAQI